MMTKRFSPLVVASIIAGSTLVALFGLQSQSLAREVCTNVPFVGRRCVWAPLADPNNEAGSTTGPVPSSRPTQNNTRYATFVYSQTKAHYSWAWGYQTSQEAENSAMQHCWSLGINDCRVLRTFTTVGAIARSDDGGSGWAVRDERGEAENAALEACRRVSNTPNTCKIIFGQHANGNKNWG